MSTALSEPRSDRAIERPHISLLGFLLITFGISWLGIIPVIIDSWRAGALPAGAAVLQLLMFFGTAIATFFVTWWNSGIPGIRALGRRLLLWRVGLRWYAFVLLAPAALFWSALQMSALLGYAAGPLRSPLDLLATFGAIFAAYLLLNTEEIAWRGYALPQLLKRYSPWRSSLILGVILAVFHIPLFLIKGGHPAGYPFPLFMAMIIAITMIFTWLSQHTGGSILLAHLLHQSFNAWAEAIPFFPRFTGSMGPLVVTVSLLALYATLIGLWWSAPRVWHGQRVDEPSMMRARSEERS